MADPSTQSFIDNLITVIYNAEEPESVTNAMVARILSYFNSTIKDVQAQIKSTIEVQTINSGRIDSIIGDNATKAIDNLNEIISFLQGFEDNDNLAYKLKDLSDSLTPRIVALSELNTMGTDGSIEAMRQLVRFRRGANTAPLHTRYAVIDQNNWVAGTLDIFSSDYSGCVLTQLLITHCILKNNSFTSGHNDSELHTYVRSFNMRSTSGLDVEIGQWTPWREYSHEVSTNSYTNLMEFYEVDDFNSPDYSHLIGGTIKLRIDCRDNTSDLGLSGSPEEVLYTVDDCIVYDRATAGFVHRRITRGELPNIYPPTIGVVRVEFRNRWLGCGEWGELDDMGAVPGDRVYCCAKTNQLYTYHNDYVNGGGIFESLQQSDPLTIDEARKLVDSIFK